MKISCNLPFSTFSEPAYQTICKGSSIYRICKKSNWTRLSHLQPLRLIQRRRLKAAAAAEIDQDQVEESLQVDTFHSQSTSFRPQQKAFFNQKKKGYTPKQHTGPPSHQNSYQQNSYQGPGNNSKRNNHMYVFCQKQGHRQEECRKRIKANKPCFTTARGRTF